MLQLRTVPLSQERGDTLDLRKRYAAIEDKYFPILEASGVFEKVTEKWRQRLIASQLAAQDDFFGLATEAGNFLNRFELQRANELVTTDQIATFTTQSLVMVLDIYEQFDWLDIVSVRPMLGPTAFVHSRTFERQDASQFYAAGSPLNEGLDPSFTECPDECARANRIGVEIGSSLIEAECRRVASDYCIPANWHLSSQYGMSIDALLDEGMRIAIQRDMQGEGLDRLRAGAGGTLSFSRTPPAGSVFTTLDPDIYQRRFWRTIRQADMDIVRAVDGKRGANILAGDPNVIQFLLELVPIDIQHNLNVARTAITVGTATEFSNFLGTVQAGRYATYLFPTMATDTLLVMVKDDAEPTFIFAPWIPFTDLGTLTLPIEARVEKGAITLFGQVMTRPGRVREVLLTA